MALDSLRPYRANKTLSYPPQRGEYFKGKDSNSAFQFCCPVCNQIFGMAAHTVDDEGKVTPSIVCPGGCGFHCWVQLNNWAPDI